MAKIVISNAIANITELKSRLRGVKTPGKRILAAAFKNNDYSALIGELLTRIELYQSVGVLDYKLKDVDTIQGMKFKFGFESVLASTLKASGVSSTPRVVQQIVRQQQVVAPVSFQNVTNKRPSNVVKLSENAEYYQDLIETATEVGALDGADADMWHIQPIKVKNSIAILISDALVKLEATGDFETVADDFGYERDIDSYLGFDPGVAILGCIVDATSGVNTGDAPISQKVPFNIAGTYDALVEDWCSPSVFEMYKKIQAKVGDSVIQKAAAYIKAKQGKPAGLVGDPMGDSVYNILESAKIKTTYENRELVRQALQTIVANY